MQGRTAKKEADQKPVHPIPSKLKRELEASAEYYRCCLLGYHECGGRITWEHAIIFKGKQVQERWAILPLCARGHGVGKWMDAGTLDKEMNVWVALNRASEEDLWAISRVINYPRERMRLNNKYGVYVPPTMEPVIPIR